MQLSAKNPITLIMAFFLLVIESEAQNSFVYSGKVIDATTKLPVQDATIHLVGAAGGTRTKTDGSFYIRTNTWYDTLEASDIAHDLLRIGLNRQQSTDLQLIMNTSSVSLHQVTISEPKKPGRPFMEKVIAHKANNDPDRLPSYSYRKYGRHELDLDNLDYGRTKSRNMKGLMASVYLGLDSTGRSDKELPIYFSEVLSVNYHSSSPKIEKESILAEKTLGLKTDEFLRHLDKFYFVFKIYNNWIAVFDQTYVSPLSDNAFSYYHFFYGDTLVENGNILRQIRFIPTHAYERAFTGTLWINDSTFAVASVNMRLTKTVNLNYIDNIYYTEEYRQTYDSASEKLIYMPARLTSEVKFEAGPSLLGIPLPENKESLRLVAKNTTVVDSIALDMKEDISQAGDLKNKENPNDLYSHSDSYWSQNRLDSLTRHEKIIYQMIDSLKGNQRFGRNVKLIAFAGTGFWDFGNHFRIGPYFTFISHNPLEGWRFRLGFWTMPGISKRLNLYGYAAYGVNDRALNGGVGLKYVWNENQWTKTSIWFGKDYDFIVDQSGELDRANIFNSFLRKKIPFSRIYVKQALLKHEQYISENLSARAMLGYKELNPVFNFSYSPFNPVSEKSIDSISLKILPVGEFSVGIRYAHKERTAIFNYDQLHLGTFSPSFTLNYTHGFELFRTHFDYDKVTFGVEQQLRVPPKSTLMYSLNVGEVFGTIPYLLLNIPAGNEYLVSGRYLFNTMTPYEFAADRYIDLHTRLLLGGLLFDHIPLIQKLGWRERISYNMYWGDMTQANQVYNKNSDFNQIGNMPFIEAGVGIENIFHILYIEYFRRLTHLNDKYAMKDGIFLGVHLAF